MQIFQELNETGITVVLVTHEPDIARHTKRMVSIRDGVVESDVPGRRTGWWPTSCWPTMVRKEGL